MIFARCVRKSRLSGYNSNTSAEPRAADSKSFLSMSSTTSWIIIARWYGRFFTALSTTETTTITENTIATPPENEIRQNGFGTRVGLPSLSFARSTCTNRQATASRCTNTIATRSRTPVVSCRNESAHASGWSVARMTMAEIRTMFIANTWTSPSATRIGTCRHFIRIRTPTPMALRSTVTAVRMPLQAAGTPNVLTAVRRIMSPASAHTRTFSRCNSHSAPMTDIFCIQSCIGPNNCPGSGCTQYIRNRQMTMSRPYSGDNAQRKQE